VLATSSSLLTNLCKLAEDLEIWSSSEFDFVDLDDGYTRASVLMPQKRNPYALSIIRGASGVLIGRLSGFLAVTKSPSARSDNLIYAYGEVPRALDLALRIARLATGVVRTLRVNGERLAEEVREGYTQATDLAEFLVQACDVDYRTAYLIVGRTVRAASRDGVPGIAITGEMIDRAAVEHRGTPLGVTGRDLSAVLDPWRIVLSRSARGGASPEALVRMTTSLRTDLTALATAAADRLAGHDAAETALLTTARRDATTPPAPADTPVPTDRGGAP
jgi:argininosuccinate lyase